MLTSKQRAKLRGIASLNETVFMIGKNGVTDETVKQLENVINKRELIKIKVLDTCEQTAREICDALVPALNCEPVQVIGSKIVLYRQNKNPEKRVISLD